MTEASLIREIAAVERRLLAVVEALDSRVAALERHHEAVDRRQDAADAKLLDFFREFSDRIAQLSETQRKTLADEVALLRTFIAAEDEELWNELPSYVSQKEYEAVKVMVFGFAGTLLLGVCYAILKNALKE